MSEMTIENALRLAAEHHRAGRLREAESLYRQVLAIDGNQPDALHLLGVLASQARQYEPAAELIQQAIALRPRWPEAHNHLGNVLKELGKLDEAQEHFRLALEYRPAFPEAQLNLGNLYKARGETEKAISCYQSAIALRPNYAEAHNNLGSALQVLGEMGKAEQAYREALQLNPRFAEALHNLGTVLRATKRGEEAIDTFQAALAMRPEYVMAHYHLGHALRAKGRLAEAVKAYGRAAELGANAEILVALASALDEGGQPEAALELFERALQMNPDYPEAWANYGNALRSRGRLGDALAAQRKAAALRPKFTEALNNIAGILRDQGHIAEAVAAFRDALLCGKDATTAANLITTLHFLPESTPRTILEEARRWDAQYAEPLRGQREKHENDRSSGRRLRIGYVSSDFVEHACAHFSESLLAHHDHDRFEVFCYAQVPHPDAVTERFQGFADHWLFVAGMSDEDFAQRIREDRIDILVDLNVHTRGNRLLVFARKPAPIQMTWLGYPGTTGLSTIDYRFTDPYLDPEGSDDTCYSETSIRLPDTFWCYVPRETDLPVQELPALRKGYVTFGSLNNFCKHNEDVLTVWAKILLGAKDSRLVLLGEPRQHALEIFRRTGVEPERIQFMPWRKRRRYLELYHEIDLGLDPFPCGGHTTNFDSLWMGVPFVTWPGKIVVGRAGLLQLTHMGLPELIASSAEEYIRITQDLAGDLPRLATLRAGLRERLEKSALMDGPRFARNVENVYRDIWRKWCAG